jgi:hypothetical protein
MTRAAAQEPSDLVLSSVTETQEQLDHAVSENWKAPFVPAAEKAEADKKAQIEEEVKAKLAETVEEEAPPEEKADESTEDEAQKIADAEEPVKGKWSKRVNKLTARNARLAEEARAANERAANLEARLAALERGEKPGATERREDAPLVADLPNKPKRADYQDESTYLEKMIQWTRANEDNREAAQAEQERLKQTYNAHRGRIDLARETHDDYDDVAKAAEHMTLSPAVEMAIMEMDNSAEVLYFLATHPEAYDKMAELTPFRQIGEATRISDKIGARGAAVPVRRQRPTAPEPIAPNGKRPTKSSVKLEDMSADDYYRARLDMRRRNRAN